MPPVKAVCHMARGQQKQQSRQKQRQPRVTQVQRPVRDGVNLPRNRNRLSLRAQNHGAARQLISPEVA